MYCFSHSQYILNFFLSHLQRWMELYTAVNWEELHNISRLELMRHKLGDLHIWNARDPQKMTTTASCKTMLFFFFTGRGKSSEAEDQWEFTLSPWTLAAAVTSASYVQVFFLLDFKNKINIAWPHSMKSNSHSVLSMWSVRVLLQSVLSVCPLVSCTVWIPLVRTGVGHLPETWSIDGLKRVPWSIWRDLCG